VIGDSPYAVLTGDIVKSTLLPPGALDRVRSDLFHAVDQVKGWDKGLVRGKAEFFGGDAWQLLLTDPRRALRVAVYLRAALLASGAVDTRVSVGLGAVDKVSPSRISLSMGEAFQLSGRGLNNMTSLSRLTIEIPTSAGQLAAWLPVVAHLCDALIARWTRRQAEIICLAAHPAEPIHEEIGRQLSPPVAKQTITKALNSADWRVVREAIHRFENTSWDALLKPDAL